MNKIKTIISILFGQNRVKFKKLDRSAIIPTRAKAGDAGFDLFSLENVPIYPENRALIKTGIAFEPPRGYFGRIAGRSGLALKHGVMVLGGVIDNGYRSDISVLLFNSDMKETLYIEKGQRIAQLLVLPYFDGGAVEAEELSSSERNTSGFGSSGK